MALTKAILIALSLIDALLAMALLISRFNNYDNDF